MGLLARNKSTVKDARDDITDSSWFTPSSGERLQHKPSSFKTRYRLKIYLIRPIRNANGTSSHLFTVGFV